METKWNLNHLFESKEEWEQVVEELKLDIQKLEKDINEITVEKVFDLIDSKYQVYEKVERTYNYAKRMLDLDNTNLEAKEMLDVVLKIYNKYLVIENRLNNYIYENREKINFQKTKYQFHIEEIIRKKMHEMNEEELKTFNRVKKAYENISTIYNDIRNLEIKYEKIPDENGKMIKVNATNLNKLLQSKNRNIREQSYKVYYGAFKSHNNTLAHLLEMKLDEQILKAEFKHFDSVLDASLFDEELNKNILEKLIKVISENSDVKEEFIEFYKNKLHLDKIYAYDMQIPIFSEIFKKYSLEESIDNIKKSLSIFGDEYLGYIDKAFSEGYGDLYSKENKRKGSFSAIAYAGVPYFSINFDQSYQSMRTLSHELGHTIHTMFSKKQGIMYYEYGTLESEIVSKVNELLLDDYMYNNSRDENEKNNILLLQIKALFNSLFNQVMLTEFEYNLYMEKENGRLSADKINQIYLDLYKKYNKGLETLECIQYNWESIVHFFIYDSYYVWKYALALSVATHIVSNLKKDKTYALKYIKFLSLGGSKSVKESLKTLDIDLEDSKYIYDSVNMLKEKVKKLKI